QTPVLHVGAAGLPDGSGRGSGIAAGCTVPLPGRPPPDRALRASHPVQEPAVLPLAARSARPAPAAGPERAAWLGAAAAGQPSLSPGVQSRCAGPVGPGPGHASSAADALLSEQAETPA